MRILLVIVTTLLTCCRFEAALAQDPPFILPSRAELSRLRSAEMVTSKGAVVFELYPEDAPWHVANLKYLADKGFYRGLTFHLYQPGYIIQGGAPNSNPNSGPGYSVPAEFSRRRHEIGSLGMARQPDSVNPERRSHGSQFHILLAESPHMNSSYTVFGKVLKGMEVVDSLRQGDRIIELRVFVRNSKS